MDLVSVKKLFFDRGKIQSAVDQATRKALAKFGAFVRRGAQTSIRTRKGTAPPGQPPFGHTGKLKSSIFFYYDPQLQSVVIGPVALRAGNLAAVRLEYGAGNYAPRPFMKPAFERELPGLPEEFRGMIK